MYTSDTAPPDERREKRALMDAHEKAVALQAAFDKVPQPVIEFFVKWLEQLEQRVAALEKK